MSIVTVSGVVYTERQAPVPGTGTGVYNWLTPGYVDGRKKVNLDFYVGLGTESAGSTINVGSLLPVGAKVIAVRVHASAATSGLTFSVGDLNLATRYASADTGPASKGVSTYTGFIDSVNGPYLIGQNPTTPTATNNDQQIVLTSGGATLGAGTIYGVEVEYTTD